MVYIAAFLLLFGTGFTIFGGHLLVNPPRNRFREIAEENGEPKRHATFAILAARVFGVVVGITGVIFLGLSILLGIAAIT